MKGFKEFLGEEDGVAIIEIVLILVILIGLIVVFNTKIKSLNTKILKKITIESNKLLWRQRKKEVWPYFLPWVCCWFYLFCLHYWKEQGYRDCKWWIPLRQIQEWTVWQRNIRRYYGINIIYCIWMVHMVGISLMRIKWAPVSWTMWLEICLKPGKTVCFEQSCAKLPCWNICLQRIMMVQVCCVRHLHIWRGICRRMLQRKCISNIRMEKRRRQMEKQNIV